MADNKILVGSIEVCDLPDLEVTDLAVRVDTGAATSSLHVDNIEIFKEGKVKWVSFDIHPDIHNVDRVVKRKAKVKAVRSIKSSNGTVQNRVVINTAFRLGDQQWGIEVTLTDRSDMTYLMLLGREAMKNKVLVDPSIEYLATDPPSEESEES